MYFVYEVLSMEANVQSADEQVGYLANRFTRLMRSRLAVELEPLDLTPPQAAVLMALGRSEGPLTPTGIADSLGMDRPTLSGVIDRLQAAGRISVDENPSDGRSRLVSLSGAGSAELPMLAEASRTIGQALRSALGPGELVVLTELLRRAIDALEPHTGVAEPGHAPGRTER